MKSRGQLRGLQFISFAQLARDTRAWAAQLPQGRFSGIIGVPRSGLTVAHMLASHLHCKCAQFRQPNGRPIVHDTSSGPILVVDDTCSNGVAMAAARAEMIGVYAEFAAVYVRRGVADSLDYCFALHNEPTWLVITEWNWFSHQDREYIAVTDAALEMTPGALGGFDCVLPQDDCIEPYINSEAAALFCVGNAHTIARATGKPVVDVLTMEVFDAATT